AFDPLLDRIGARPAERLEVRNAISSEMPGLRTHLGPNLLGVLEKNANEEERVRVFEIGRTYQVERTEEGLPKQPTTLGAMVARRDDQEGPELFMELKGILQGLGRAVGRVRLDLSQGGVEHPWAHPVRQATLSCEGQTIGALYEVHPLTLHQLDLPHGAALLEVNLDLWREGPGLPVSYRPIPRYPAVFRDFAVVVAEDVTGAQVEAAIHSAAPDRVEAVRFQSLYRGGGVPEGQKSMAWAVTLRWEDGTLGESEVKTLEAAIWSALADQVEGAPRA
ncbi:MAG: hypothetical protein VX938_12620, partial [Myxococcota bacterium]|nr:hypothetical protein [Myxococcota bacterium]